METLSEIGVFVVFPSSDSVPRCPSSLHGVPRVGSPASSVLLEHSDSPWPLPPHFVSFAWRYRGGVPLFVPTGGRTPDACEPGPLLAGGPPGAAPAETLGSPRFLGEPLRACRRSPTPGGPRRQAVAAPRCCLRTIHGVWLPRQAPFGAQSRSLRARCLRFVGRVAPLPRKTRFRLVANLAGQDFHLLGSR